MKVLKTVWKFVKAFGLFWKNFLVGDSPELALGVLIVLGTAFLLHNSTAAAAAAVIFLVVLLISLTVWRKARK
jgi:ABC-type spermidine/putrescine transport system permease subunit I